jgi:hypothetical protein
MSKSTESISKSVEISTKNPLLFVPALAPLVIHLLFLLLAYVVFPIRTIGFGWPEIIHEVLIPNPWLVWGGYFIASIVGFIASCMIVNMANDIINQRPANLNKSLNLVMSRLGDLIVAAIIAALCSITIILIPVALFLAAITIIEGTDAVESTKEAFNFVIKNLGEVILFVIILVVLSIVFSFVFGFIPVIGAYLGSIIQWLVNVIFTVVAIKLYLTLKQTPPPPPPPPPPL